MCSKSRRRRTSSRSRTARSGCGSSTAGFVGWMPRVGARSSLRSLPRQSSEGCAMSAVTRSPLGDLDYRPVFPPGYAPGVGIVGCGGIAKEWHLPTYARYGVDVIGVYDRVSEATHDVLKTFPFVKRVYASLDELLADPQVDIVDVATGPETRLDVIEGAAAAGKHVLAQKPLALDVRAARESVENADRHGIKLAVNQNGRWSPPWRIATLLIEDGAIGDVVAVTHVLDKPLPP